MNLANSHDDSHDVHCLVPANMRPWIRDMFLEADVLFTVKMDDYHWSLIITTFNWLIKSYLQSKQAIHLRLRESEWGSCLAVKTVAISDHPPRFTLDTREV